MFVWYRNVFTSPFRRKWYRFWSCRSCQVKCFLLIQRNKFKHWYRMWKKREHALNFKLWNIFLFPNLLRLSRNTLQKEWKFYTEHDWEKWDGVAKYSLTDVSFDWEIVFPKWGKSGQFSSDCIGFQCGQRAQHGFEVELILVGFYSLPWYFIEKLTYYCLFLNLITY